MSTNKERLNELEARVKKLEARFARKGKAERVAGVHGRDWGAPPDPANKAPLIVLTGRLGKLRS